MKRIVLSFIALSLILTISGCSKSENPVATDVTNIDSQSLISETVVTSNTTTEIVNETNVDVGSYFSEFPDVDSFERDFGEVIRKVLISCELDSHIDTYTITDFDIVDIADELKDDEGFCVDQTVFLSYGPIGLMGSVVDGKVISAFTFIVTIEQDMQEALDADGFASMLPLFMAPTSLFDRKYSDYSSLFNLASNIIENGVYSNNDEECTLIKDNITYKIHYSEAMRGYTIDAKELWFGKCEKLADEFLNYNDYENAIYYYNKAEVSSDKLKEAYYMKAEAFLTNDDLDNAETYFNLIWDYKDVDIRLLEVNYKKGENYLRKDDYSSAMSCFELAGGYSDAYEKYKECCFKQGEIYSKNKQYSDAIILFNNAADYEGAKDGYKEACYNYAEQLLTLENMSDATYYFAEAGDYKDASSRMNSYYYNKGCEYLSSNSYLEAVSSFSEDLTYLDSMEKYKEACYLYGEELLNYGDIQSAKEYFYKADDYKDATTRVERYYYENGEKYFNNQDYLSASEMYMSAGEYSDSETMILECYYQYGIMQMNLNYISDAITYLSMCRGYKDTDEILLGYYYDGATKAVNVLMDAFSAKTFTTTVDNAYMDAKNKLVLCEGYKDSVTLLTIVEKLYYVWMEMPFESYWEASLSEMVVSYSGDDVFITKTNFMTGTSCTLSMTYNIKNNTFSADITHMFNPSARGYDVRKVISAMLVLFADIKNTTDFDTKFSDTSNWTISGDNESFVMAYGGYNISIQTKPESYGYIDCSISVTK